MKKRILALALALVMLLTFLPAAALAAEGVTVYVTVSQDGGFVKDRNGNDVAYVPVEVGEDSPTVKDVFLALHENYYADGAAGFSETGGFISKFWGIASSSVGYYKNNDYVLTLSEGVSAGDHIVFWFYQDTSMWSDEYTYFDKLTETVPGGEGVSLTLSGWSGGYEGAQITADGALLTGKVTDENGGVTLYFADKGKYTVSAAATEGYIVPPVCVVTVTGDDMEARETVESDALALTLPEEAREDLALPAVGRSGKTGIVWTSGDEEVISSDGRVFRGAEDRRVTLTADITYGSHTASRDIEVAVPALDGGEELLDRAAELLAEPFEVSQYNEDGTDGDRNIMVSLRDYLESGGIRNVAVAMVSSDNAAIDGVTGDIVYPEETVTGDVTVKLTAADASRDVTVTVTVPERTPTRQEVMDEAVRYLESTILGGNEDFDHVKTDLNLPSRGSTVSGYSFVQVNYTIPNVAEGYLSGSLGGVTRPDETVGDVSFTLSLTVHWYSEIEQWIPSGYVGPNPPDRILTYDITIPAVTEEERAGTKAWLDSLDPRDFISLANGEPAELDAVTSDLNLGKVPGAEQTRWASGNEAVIKGPAGYTGTAAVTRPEFGEEDAQVVLTVTAAKEGVTVSRDIAVTVMAKSDPDAENALNDLLDGIAAGYTEDHSHWEIISDMSAYGAFRPGGAATSDSARRGYISSAIGTVTGDNVTEAELAGAIIALHSVGADPRELYPNGNGGAFDAVSALNAMEHSSSEWSAPYVLWAWLQGGYASGADGELISTVLSAQHEDGSWNSLSGVFATPVDSTANILIGLAPYSDNGEVMRAVDRALDYLSGQQDEATGGFSGGSGPVNANSTALVLTALCGLGVNPYSDGRFLTGDGRSAVDGLLGFALEDGSGFGYTDNTAKNGLATRQGFTALLALRAFIDKKPAVYDFRAVEVAPAYAVDDETNANITSITLTPGDIVKAPDEENMVDFSVENAVSSVRLTVECAERTAGVTVTLGDVSQNVSSGVTTGGFDISTGGNVFDLTVTAPDGVTEKSYTVTVTRAEAPAGGDGERGVSVSFTVTGDTLHYDFESGMNTGAHSPEVWVSRSVTVPEGSTVKYVTELVLGIEGVDYDSSGGYISGINGLKELDNGPNSGWLYRVNELIPQVGYSEYVVKDGDRVSWFYTDDYSNETGYEGGWNGGDSSTVSLGTDGAIDDENMKDAADAAVKEGADRVTVTTETVDGKASVGISAGAAKYLSGAGLDLRVETSLGAVTVPAEGLANLTDRLTVSIEKRDGYIDVLVKSGDSVLYALPGGIKAALPRDGGNVLIIIKDGGESVVRKSVLEGDRIYALLPGSARVAVRTAAVEYSDVDVGWYEKGVEFAGAHELMEGVGGGLFAPDMAVTRAMLATALWRLEDCPGAEPSRFEDVSRGAWYYDAAAWAGSAGIVLGTDRGFEPETVLDRETMAVMLWRYAGLLGLDTGSAGNLDSFEDADDVDDWAREAMAWAVGAGMIRGDGQGRLSPRAVTGRAQCAVMLERIVGLIVK